MRPSIGITTDIPAAAERPLTGSATAFIVGRRVADLADEPAPAVPLRAIADGYDGELMGTGAGISGEYRTKLFHAIRDTTADASVREPWLPPWARTGGEHGRNEVACPFSASCRRRGVRRLVPRDEPAVRRRLFAQRLVTRKHYDMVWAKTLARRAAGISGD